MNKFKKIFISFAFVLCTIVSAFLLTACGGSAKTITDLYLKYEDYLSNYQYINITYGTTVGSLMNNVKYYFAYSNGDRVEINDDNYTEEELNSWAETFRENYYVCTGQDETTYQDIWEVYEGDVSYSTKLDVGKYKFEFEIASKKAQIILYVEKADYTGNGVYVSLQPSQMTYGGDLSEPHLTNNVGTTLDVTYYYQEANDNYEITDSYMEYNYEQGAKCDILAGNYQLFARVETKNYNIITTHAIPFTVHTTTKTNYALFNAEPIMIYEPGGGGTSSGYSTYTRFNGNNVDNAFEIYYQFGKNKISDYISSVGHNLYVCEVDGDGNIIFDDNYTSLRRPVNNNYYFINGQGEYVAWSTSWNTLYVQSGDNKVLNDSNILDWEKTYYSKDITYDPDTGDELYSNYRENCFFYLDVDYSVANYNNGETFYVYNGEEYVEWSQIYDKLYIDNGGIKELNTSEEIDFTRTYYRQDNSVPFADWYFEAYIYYKKDAYKYLGGPIEEYYVYNGEEYVTWAEGYNSLYVNDGNTKVPNENPEIDWNKAYFARYYNGETYYYNRVELCFKTQKPRYEYSFSYLFGTQTWDIYYTEATYNGYNINNYYVLDEDVYKKWTEEYTNLYVDNNGVKEQNTSITIDLSKDYYVYKNEEYVQVTIYYQEKIYHPLVLNGNDQDVSAPGTFTVGFKFSENIGMYSQNYIYNLTIKIKIKKASISISNLLRIDGDYGNDGEVEYDGNEHHLNLEPFRLVTDEYGNSWYSGNYIYDESEDKYYYVEANYRDEQDNPYKIFEITNLTATEVGTYNVICTLLEDFRALIDLEYYDNGEYHYNYQFDVGSWKINKRVYELDADIKLNGTDIDEYKEGDSIYVKLPYDVTYEITVENLQAYKMVPVEGGDPQRENDDNVNITLQSVRVLYDGSNATGVTIEDNTSVTFSNSCPEYVTLQIEFSLNNESYENVVFEYYIQKKVSE